MKNYDLPDDRPMVTGIDVAGIFIKHDQDKAYKSSLYSDIGWREEQDGYLHKDNYMVDIETGQRWKWSRNQSIEWTDLTIEYPTLLD